LKFDIKKPIQNISKTFKITLTICRSGWQWYILLVKGDHYVGD